MLRKFKSKYRQFLFQNRWAEIVVGVTILGLSLGGMWLFYHHFTTKQWVYQEFVTGEVIALRTQGKYPIVYSIIKLENGDRVISEIPIEYDVRKGHWVVLDKYVNEKNGREYRYSYNIDHQK